jgi:hypothetical protein
MPERQTGDARPIPDPTTLTTAQLHREILALRELTEEKFVGLRAQLSERKESLALALAKSDSALDTNMKSVDAKIDGLKERLTIIEAKSSGRGEIVGWLIGAFGVMTALAAVFVKH